jgi:murein DD-endopeptidase MepM/ murein hydrolase activator NlpD
MVVVTRVAKVPPSSKYDTGLVTIRRTTLGVSLFAATILAGWSAGSTWLVLSKDSFAGHMIKRETARQYVYEDRIAALKAEIDKLSSRQLVDQDSVESRVAELVTRQGQLETRQAIVAAIADSISGQQLVSGRVARGNPILPQAAITGSVTSNGAASSTGITSFAPTARPMPVPDMPGLRREPERRTTSAGAWDQSALEPAKSLDEHLGKVERSIGAVSAAQIKALNRIEASVASAHASLKSVVTDVGLDPDRMLAASRQPGQGGPLVPANLDPKAGPFEASVVRLQPRIASVERLRTVVTALPVRRPMGPEAEQSSPFGHRLDPFTRGLAMHTGLDFRAEHGTPVRTAGSGRVVMAEYNGGYGNMVEIDHGHGLTTRYAHLSHIAVSEGQQVASGTVVGRVGSTGRSTGPHLHYETRIDGDAVDPQRFIRAGQRFFAQN